VTVSGTVATAVTANSGIASPTAMVVGMSALITTLIGCVPMSGNGQV
jgi:hypothetical protein